MKRWRIMTETGIVEVPEDYGRRLIEQGGRLMPEMAKAEKPAKEERPEAEDAEGGEEAADAEKKPRRGRKKG